MMMILQKVFYWPWCNENMLNFLLKRKICLKSAARLYLLNPSVSAPAPLLLMSHVAPTPPSSVCNARWGSGGGVYHGQHCTGDIHSSGRSGTKHSGFNPIYLLGAFFGLFGGSDDDSGKVPPSVKRQILYSQRALRELDYPTSQWALHEALRLLAESPHASTQPFIEARAVVLDMLANVYLEQNKLEEAEANFKETMRVMLTAGVQQEDEALIEISLKIAKIYANQKKYDRAVAGFEWCVKAAKNKESLALYGMCVQAKGQYHLLVGESSQAASELIEAVRVAEKVYGTNHLQVAVLRNDLATALDAMNDFKQAEELVHKSIAIAESLTEQDVSEELAIFYLNLGIILYHQGGTADALKALSKAMFHAKKTKNKLLQGNIRRELKHTELD